MGTQDGRGGGERSSQPHWWTEYFDEDFIHLYRPFLPAERTGREVAGIIAALDLEPDSRVLDIACGWGRHAVELAREGCQVSGLDRSETLLRQAQRNAVQARVQVQWVRGDVRDLPWTGDFDAAICVFSSLGYFLSDQEDLRALQAARAALRPGGCLLLETMHRDGIVREFAERDWWEGEGGTHLWVEREFDALAGVSHEWLRWRRGDGSEGEKYHAIRIRTATEWEAILRQAGLEPEAWYGDWDLGDFTHTSPRLIVVARRPA
jgi:SAM-dependent methyltransferase